MPQNPPPQNTPVAPPDDDELVGEVTGLDGGDIMVSYATEAIVTTPLAATEPLEDGDEWYRRDSLMLEDVSAGILYSFRGK